MSDELVERLRSDWFGYDVSLKAIDAMEEAADRIEALTAERDHAWAMVAKADTQMGQSLADHLQAKVENDRLRDALRGLERASTEVVSCGARTGPQWLKLTVANLSARGALK